MYSNHKQYVPLLGSYLGGMRGMYGMRGVRVAGLCMCVVKLICFHAYGNKKMRRNLLAVSGGLAFTVSES